MILKCYHSSINAHRSSTSWQCLSIFIRVAAPFIIFAVNFGILRPYDSCTRQFCVSEGICQIAKVGSYSSPSTVFHKSPNSWGRPSLRMGQIWNGLGGRGLHWEWCRFSRPQTAHQITCLYSTIRNAIFGGPKRTPGIHVLLSRKPPLSNHISSHST